MYLLLLSINLVVHKDFLLLFLLKMLRGMLFRDLKEELGTAFLFFLALSYMADHNKQNKQ